MDGVFFVLITVKFVMNLTTSIEKFRYDKDNY